ncbi:(S)-2-hydroxy-acid oxidase [Catenulispora acidiphila DSM 44928]|uniref:(S)-2-hydroxy-acid oxidase n=1 Tax=Catenulispora acidiphila (strain DSM 44928 / JCM 14897 / NBRC 102108 / NRRL B-24433 / ID139908) TaxID=479433 RepID=C7Q7H9_CATAD|nr:alpha-hydroxy acid oxidase [Catenulispora acidiphila]ACU72172.1 (S)-2-hydroxy-acid oxidase [Catenulispora acidiphila DSM 44928]
MHTTVPPGAGAAAEPVDHWGVRRAVRLAFPGPSSLAADTVHTARLDVYLTDLLQPHGLALNPGALAPRGQSYGEMAEALIELAVPAGEGVDLLVMAYAIPDITPGRATTTYLSHVCPGQPMSFAISDEGTAAGFTGLRLIREYARSGGFRRALLLVVEQAWLAYDPGVPAAMPSGHSGVALLFGDGDSDPGLHGTSEPLATVGPVQVRAGAVEGSPGAEIEELGDARTVILGAVLKAEADELAGRAEVVLASPGRPYTGVWWDLVGALEADSAEVGAHRVILADADPDLGFLCTAALDVQGRRSGSGPEPSAPLLCFEDYRGAAQERVAAEIWDFVDGGADTERTVTANRRAFARAEIRPRALVDTEVCDTRTAILGSTLGTPLAVAPTAYHRLVHPEGEVATAQGAGAADALYTVSIFASRTLEDIAASASGPLWLQLYWLRQREAMVTLIDRAAAAGYRALVLTVDIPRMGRRLRDMRNGFAVGPDCAAVNLDAALMASAHLRGAGKSALAVHTAQTIDPSVTWADLAWLRERSDLPLVLKGILTAEDARLAVSYGADAIIVSNHGGRQLDGAVPSLTALPEVVAAVAGACPVMVDGGVRSGGDAFAALALGAQAVFLGRPVLWGLAVGGAAGVAGLLDLATGELAHTMALAGRPGLDLIDRSAVRFEQYGERMEP